MGTPEGGENTPRSWTASITPTVLYGTDEVTGPPLPPLAPICWRRIPQQQYTPRMRDRSFLQLQRIAFSIDGVPGFSIQRALDQVFVGLDGRDDPVLENASGPVSCRLLVRQWHVQPSPKTLNSSTLGLTSSLGTQPTPGLTKYETCISLPVQGFMVL